MKQRAILQSDRYRKQSIYMIPTLQTHETLCYMHTIYLSSMYQVLQYYAKICDGSKGYKDITFKLLSHCHSITL